MQNAASGQSSPLPSSRAANPSIVSLRATNLPFRPVNTSDMKKGCERNFCTFLARATVILSSSESSSMPRMAIMSWRDLQSWSNFCTPRATVQWRSPTMTGSRILLVESRGSTAGYIPSSVSPRDNTVVASRKAKVVAGAGSVKSSAGTQIACTEVIDPFLVVVMRSWRAPKSVARVGWQPTAEGILPRRADTSEHAWVKRKMLSMKRRTSLPSSSRKYSATVRPVSPTRALAPGGSFICPQMSAHLEPGPSFFITPDSIISWQRSFPSRVRSPTPAKTEYPPWALATLLISSWITTVLPTPAPPNSPILPPRAYGASRSTTLIPVIKIQAPEPCSSKEGASRWMGQNFLAGIGPFSSIASPMTFMILPRVSGPTGMVMGAPVSATSWPLTKPQVESMAMVLTRESPRCCATQRTSLCSVPLTSSALRMGGISPSNCTSTTAPMTCEICPTLTVLKPRLSGKPSLASRCIINC